MHYYKMIRYSFTGNYEDCLILNLKISKFLSFFIKSILLVFKFIITTSTPILLHSISQKTCSV